MSGITRADIDAAIRKATGDPSSGAVHDWTPVIAEAIERLIRGDRGPGGSVKENRIIKAAEIRTGEEPDGM